MKMLHSIRSGSDPIRNTKGIRQAVLYRGALLRAITLFAFIAAAKLRLTLARGKISPPALPRLYDYYFI